MSDSETTAAGTGEGPLAPAQAVILAFGGIRPMAHKLGIAVSTVQGWKERGTIPRGRHPEIQAAAEAAGLALDPALLAASDQTQAPVIEGVGAPVPEPAAPETAEPEAAPSGAAGPRPGPGPEAPPRPAPETTAATHGASPVRRPPRAPLLLGGAALGALVLAAGFLLATQTTDLWQDGAPAGGGVSGVSGDRGALEALEQRLAALETAAPGAPESRLAALEERLEALEGEIAALPAGGDPAALEALRGELLEAARAEVAPLRAGLDETRKSLADLAARVTALPAASAEGDAGEGRAALGSALDELTGRVLALEATAQTLAGKLGALDLLDQRIADQVGAAEARLESRLATALASQEQAAAAPDAATASLALAAAALKDAVVAGRPYASELALLRQLAAGDAAVNAALDPLVASAEQGLPSESALFAAFPATAEAIVAAERAAAGGDWLDDLWASLGGLVTVRPIGEVAGEGAAARVARAERRLAEGDLAAAVTELEGLTGAPAEAAAGWLGGARARLAALEAADALVRQSLARLGAATPPSGG